MKKMASFFTEEHKNWIKLAHGLLVVKDGVAAFIDREFKTFHQTLQHQHGTATCTSCKTNAKTNVKIICPNNICSKWVKAITAEKAGGRLDWENCDLQSLPTTYWELAKVFMGHGQKPTNTGPEQTDTSNLLTTLINCKLFDKKVDVAVVRTVRNRRNDLFHAGQQEVDGTTMKACFNDMDMFLGDSKLSPHCPEANAARLRLKEISSTGFVVTPEHEQRAYTELLSTMTSFVSQILDDMSHVRQDVPQMMTDLAGLKTQLAAVMTTIENKLSTKQDVEALGRKIDSSIKASKVEGMRTRKKLETDKKEVKDTVVEDGAKTRLLVASLEKKLTDPDIVDELRNALKSHYETKLKEYDIGIKSDPFPAHVHLQADYVKHQLQHCQHESVDTGSSSPSIATPAARRILVENKQADSEKYTLALKLISNWVNAMKCSSTSETYRIPILLDGKKKMTGDIYDSIVKQLLGKSWLHRRQELENWMLLNENTILVLFDGYHESCSSKLVGMSYKVDDGAVPKFLSDIICNELLTEVHLLVTSKPGFVQNTKYFTDVYCLRGLGHTTMSNHKELFSFVREHTTRRFDSQKRDSQQLDATFLKLGKYALATIRKKWDDEERVMNYPREEINKLSFDILPDEEDDISLIGIVQRSDGPSPNVQFTHAAFAEFLAAKFLSDTSNYERRETLKDILLEPHLHQVLRSACNLASADPDGALEDMFEVWNELMPSRNLMRYIYQTENSYIFLPNMSNQKLWHQLSHIPFVWLLEIDNPKHKETLVKNILEHSHAIYITGRCKDCIDGMQVFFEVANKITAPDQHIDIYVHPLGSEVKLVDFYQAVEAFKSLGTLFIRDSGENAVNFISKKDKSKVNYLAIDFDCHEEIQVGGGSNLRGLSLYGITHVNILQTLGSAEKLERLHIHTKCDSISKTVLDNFISGCTPLKDFALEMDPSCPSVEGIFEKLAQKELLRLHLNQVTFGEKEKHLVTILQNTKLEALRIHERHLDPYDERTRYNVLKEGLGGMTSLEELGLSVKYQSILDLVAPLIPSFGKLRTLVLELGKDVRLSGLASGLCNSKSLCKLVLEGGQDVTDEDAENFTKCLKGLESLFVFSISYVNLSKGHGLSSIARGFEKHESLSMISFIDCSLKDAQLDEISGMLISNPRIQSLTLANLGGFTQDSMDKFVESLKGRPRMFNLHVPSRNHVEAAKLDQFRLSNCRIE